MVSPPATAPTRTAASWNYHPAEITQTRRFLAVSKKNDAFQYSRPDLDAVPATVLRETPILYPGAHSHPSRPFPCSTRYALQSVLNSPTMLWPYRSMWEQDLIIHAMEKPLAPPMCTLLLQKDASLLAVSDGDAFNPHGSFGWVLALTRKNYGIAPGRTMASHQATRCTSELKGMVATPYSCS
jgi:hypothetical protein